MFKILATQAWYYRNIIAIAETGHGNLDLNIWSALIGNIKHETNKAKELIGIDNCVGQVYKGDGGSNESIKNRGRIG